MDFKSYQDITEEIVKKDDARDKFFSQCDAHVHGVWEKPAAWKDISWIRPFKTSDNANAYDASVRTLATKHPALSIMPLLGEDTEANKEARKSFNLIEKGLDWHYRQAERRMDTNPTRAIVSSVLMYDEYVGQEVYLPHQQSALGAINGRRSKRASQYGPFATIIHKPSTVHTLYSDYMLEKLVQRKMVPAHQFCAFWGDLAKDLKDKITQLDKNGQQLIDEDIESNYYIDDDVCIVWATLSGGGKDSIFKIIAPNTKQARNDLGFIPWFHGVGGSGIESAEEYRRKPLLNNIIRSGAWHNQMLFGSLMFSLAMSRAAQPVSTSLTPTGEGIEIDMTEPMGDASRRPGEEYTRLPPAGIDPVVKEMFDRLSAWINTSSGTKVLQTLDYPQGSAFATVNAIIQAAVSVLDPFKQLAEQGIADSYRLKVAWLKYKKADLTFYDTNDAKSPTYGSPSTISWESLPNQEDLYMSVELKPSIPTDEMQRINAATMMARDLNFPNARLLEMLDVTDPQQATEEWRQEQKDNATLQNEIQNLQLENQLQQEQIKMQFQQQMSQQAQPQQGQPQPGQVQGQQPANNVASAPFDSAQGQGNNAAAGGTPTNAAAPTMGREQITGNPKEMRGLDMGSGGA